MTRLMYDSTSPWDIPRDAEMVAYYVDGRYAWPQAWLDLFPNAQKVSISAIGVKPAQVGDVEVGCIWPPSNAPAWLEMARRAGYNPSLYVNELNDWAPTRSAIAAAGVEQPAAWWTARYNGVRQIPAGAVARQFAHPHDGDGIANNPWETGKHYDLSIVADYWPGVDDHGPGGGGGGSTVSMQDVFRAFEYMAQNPTSPEAENFRQVAVHYEMDRVHVGGTTSIHIETANLAANFQEVLTRLATIAESLNTPAPISLTPEQLEEMIETLKAAVPTSTDVADEIDRRARDNDPNTGPRS